MLPERAICLDAFHVVSWATAALDEVRREVWNAACRTGMEGDAKALKPHWCVALASSGEYRADIEAALTQELSNARTEAMNTRIRLIARRAFGFHSAEALIALSELSLWPLSDAVKIRVVVRRCLKLNGLPGLTVHLF